MVSLENTLRAKLCPRANMVREPGRVNRRPTRLARGGCGLQNAGHGRSSTIERSHERGAFRQLGLSNEGDVMRIMRGGAFWVAAVGLVMLAGCKSAEQKEA